MKRKGSLYRVYTLYYVHFLGVSGGGCGNWLQYSCLENPHGERSLEGYSPSGCKESDSTEQLSPHSICLHGTQRQAPLRNEGVRRVLSWKARACAAFCVCLRE